MSWPWNLGQRSLKVIGADMDRSATYDFLLTLHSNRGPISRCFRNRRRFQSKIANFPRVFNSPGEGVPLELGIGARGQKTRMVGYQMVKNVLRSVQPFRHITGVWQTDRQPFFDSKDRVYAYSAARVRTVGLAGRTTNGSVQYPMDGARVRTC